MKLKSIATAAALAVLPLTVSAHAPKIGHNGGPQVDAESYHVEIVPKGTVLQVYLRDQSDNAVSTRGFKGIAIFVIKGKPERITLTPAGDNQLKGDAKVDLPAEPKGAVQITTPTGGTVQAKFD